ESLLESALPTPSPGDLLLDRGLEGLLAEALGELREERRSALLLRIDHGLPYEEIAQVMGHRGAGWLERPGREEEEGTDLLIEALDLRAEDVVADIGAGSGYFTFKLSKEVPQGEVLAVDIQDEMLKIIRQRMKQQEVENIELVLGEVDQPNLPEDSVDLVLMVDAYHEFSHPREMMQGIVDALAPGGRVVLAEYRAEDPSIMIKPLHKMSEEQVVKEMRAVGLELIENRGLLPQQHLLFFRKAQ
ncbi:MAG: methyltransferase domain-containing protein, partial [bacterium]